MMAEFVKGDHIIALAHDNSTWIVAKIVDWLPRAEQFQIRVWDYGKGAFGKVQRMPPMNIAGRVTPKQAKVAAERLQGVNQYRKHEVQKADREARRRAFKLLA